MKSQSDGLRESAKPSQPATAKRSKSAKVAANLRPQVATVAGVGREGSPPLKTAAALWSAAGMETAAPTPQVTNLEASAAALQLVRDRMEDYLRGASGYDRQDAIAVLDLLRAALARVQRIRNTDDVRRSDAKCYGVLVRERRLAAGLSQPAVARLAGLAVNTIKNVESGKIEPTLATMQRLSSVLELGLAEPTATTAPDRTASGSRANSFLGPRYDAAAMLDDLVATCNQPRGELDQTYLYVDNQSAKDWLKMSNAAPYVAAFRSQAPYELAAQQCAQLLGQGAVRIAGLGSGDGKSETRFTAALCDSLGAASPAQLLLMDISHTLVCAAFKHAYDQLAGRVDLMAIHANFHDLGRCQPLHEDRDLVRPRRVYTLLGHTMANLRNELDLFSEIARWTKRGDLLVLEFQTTKAPASDPDAVRAAEPPLQHGAAPSSVQWLTGPLRRHCEDFAEIQLRMELNTHVAIPGGYELLCMGDVTTRSKQRREFLVTRLKRYDAQQLGSFLAGRGWEAVLTLPYGGESGPGAAVMVLQRS